MKRFLGLKRRRREMGRGQYHYDHRSVQSESFKLQDFILPPCSIPRNPKSVRAYRQSGVTTYFDCPTIHIDQRNRLTPELIDKLYEHVLRTHSIECAANVYCVPIATISTWMSDGKKYLEAKERGDPVREDHILRCILYLRLLQAKALKQSEKRARVMRAVKDRDWVRNLSVLEKMEPEGKEAFGRKPKQEETAKEHYVPLPDEAYM